MFLWHTGPLVSNREKHTWMSVISDCQIHFHVAAWRAETDGVANDVLESAPESMRIAVFKENGTLGFQTYGFTERLCFKVSVSSYFFDQLRQIHTLSRARGETRLEARKHEYLIHQRLDFSHVTVHLIEQTLRPRSRRLS